MSNRLPSHINPVGILIDLFSVNFHILRYGGLFFACMTEVKLNTKLAFKFLEDVKDEFKYIFPNEDISVDEYGRFMSIYYNLLVNL
jgi:hypothetical protein